MDSKLFQAIFTPLTKHNRPYRGGPPLKAAHEPIVIACDPITSIRGHVHSTVAKRAGNSVQLCHKKKKKKQFRGLTFSVFHTSVLAAVFAQFTSEREFVWRWTAHGAHGSARYSSVWYYASGNSCLSTGDHNCDVDISTVARVSDGTCLQ